ncbi:hypothetical protein V2A60_002073 [Cordyceps javanica]
MADTVTYRAAREADLPQIRAINAHYILHTSASLKRVVPRLASFYDGWQDLRNRGLPYLVATDTGPDSCPGPDPDGVRHEDNDDTDGDTGSDSDGDRVLGYACLAPYRASYPPTAELSLFVHPAHRSRAVGSALLARILRRVREGTVVHRWPDRGEGAAAAAAAAAAVVVPTVVRSVVAVMTVDPESKEGGEALRRFYAQRGFAECGRLVKAGWKRGHCTRRVKCDEKKPVCGNCAIKSRPCDISGEIIVRGRQTKSLSPPSKNQPSPAHSEATTPTSTSTAPDSQRTIVARRASHHFIHDVTPRGWDWVEACEYSLARAPPRPGNSVLPVTSEQDLMLPSSFIRKPGKINWSPGPTFTVFIMGALAHSMSRTCRLLGSSVETEPLPEMARMRQKYNRYMGEELQNLNRDIARPENYGVTRVFGRLIGLIVSEIDFNSPNLRLHIKGFITLLSVSGGIQKVLERKEANILAIIHVIVSATVMNTTSPSTDMISGAFAFTNQEIYTCYASTLHVSFPCPTQLFLCIGDVNRLRQQIASGEHGAAAAAAGLLLPLRASVRAVLESIAAFDPDRWLERYEMPRVAFRAALARIYQAAVAFYAKLTLAAHAGIGYDADRRIADARHLVRLIVSAEAASVPPKAVCWPLIVAGAGLAGADADAGTGTGGRCYSSDMAVVEQRLHEVGSRDDASDGPLQALAMLRAHWISGNTGWDDCFAVPLFPLTE